MHGMCMSCKLCAAKKRPGGLAESFCFLIFAKSANYWAIVPYCSSVYLRLRRRVKPMAARPARTAKCAASGTEVTEMLPVVKNAEVSQNMPSASTALERSKKHAADYGVRVDKLEHVAVLESEGRPSRRISCRPRLQTTLLKRATMSRLRRC